MGPLARLNSLPRVRAGRIVLSRAQWRISAGETKSFCNVDRYTAFLKVKEMQQRRGIPRWVLLTEFDNQLPVDLDNPLSVDSLVHLLKRSPEATLIEMYPQYQNRSVVGPEGAYEHELVIPLTSKCPMPNRDIAIPTISDLALLHIESDPSAPQSERLRSPGSDWHFVKLYGGQSLLDDLLITNLGPLMSALVTNGSLKRWFFVRYSDPETHLRLRFQSPEANANEDINRAIELLLANGHIWKIQVDTYYREIERYGGLEGLLASEDIFCADSEAVLTVLLNLEGDNAADMRWKIALYGLDAFLADCGLEIHEKVSLMDRLRKSFAHEFRLSSQDKEKLGIRFRSERNHLQSMLRKDSLAHGPAFDIALQAFARRSRQTKSAIAHLRALEVRDSLTTTFLEIVASHLHMQINRITQSSPRAHELVMYDFLFRHYNGIYARTQNMSSDGNVSPSTTKLGGQRKLPKG